MNHGQEPASGTRHRRRGFAWLLAIALFALIGSLLGGVVMLIDVQADVANPPDTGPRPTR